MEEGIKRRGGGKLFGGKAVVKRRSEQVEYRDIRPKRADWDERRRWQKYLGRTFQPKGEKPHRRKPKEPNERQKERRGVKKQGYERGSPLSKSRGSHGERGRGESLEDDATSTIRFELDTKKGKKLTGEKRRETKIWDK